MVFLFRKCNLLSIKLILSLVFAFVKAFAEQTELLSPGSTGTNSGAGTRNWSNTGNIGSSDNNRATCGALILGDITYYLTATNFGFSIPDDATIDGIVVEIEKSATGLLANVTDYSVRIIKGGSISGSNLAGSGSWPSSDAYSVYGGASALWGLTWSPTDINSSNFGIAVSANLGGVAVLPTARIDHIRISVYYTPPPLPVNLLYFKAEHKNDHVLAEWATASQYNVNQYKVYSSLDGEYWKEAGIRHIVIPSTSIQTFAFEDYYENSVPLYYRLTEIRFNYSEHLLAQIKVKRKEKKLTGIVCYPNPFNNEINIAFEEPVTSPVKVILADNSGKIVYHELFTDKILKHKVTLRPELISSSHNFFLHIENLTERIAVSLMRENH